MTVMEEILMDKLAQGNALHYLRQGLRNLIQKYPYHPLISELRKLLEESYEKECWND